MARNFLVTIIFFSVLALIITQYASGFYRPPSDFGSTGPYLPNGPVSSGPSNLSCNIPIIGKILCIVKKVYDWLQSIQKITQVLDYTPHQFSFGGPILVSERACTFKFDEYTFAYTICTPLGCYTPAIGPITVPIPLVGRGIIVGPPVPTYTGSFDPTNPTVIPPGGKVIAFPWISRIFEQHTENRAGPWALGLGFTPFPLGEINTALDSIRIRIPPNVLDLANTPCWVPVPGYYTGVCFDNLRFDCSASGELDPITGLEIYKVIRLLGTSKDNAPASAFPTGFPVP